MKKKRLLLTVVSALLVIMPFTTYAEDPTPDPTPPVIEPTPELKKSYLSDLSIKDFVTDQVFSKDTYVYTLKVLETTASITIEASADSNSIIFSGNGVKTVKPGLNEFRVISKLKDSDITATYIIRVTRPVIDITLSSLKVVGYTFLEAFDKDRLTYTLEVPFDVESLNFTAVTTDTKATYVIEGAENLKVGTNVVTITVTSASSEKKVYTINVTRLEENKEVVPPVTSKEEVNPPLNNNESNNTSFKTDSLKYILLGIGCSLLIITAGLGGYFYLKSTKKKKSFEGKEKIEIIEEEIIINSSDMEEVFEAIDDEENMSNIDLLADTKEGPIIDHFEVIESIDKIEKLDE